MKFEARESASTMETVDTPIRVPESHCADIPRETTAEDDRNRFYEGILDNLRDNILVTDQHDLVIYANDAMAKLSGPDRTRILGSGIAACFPEDTLRDFTPPYLDAKTTLRPTPCTTRWVAPNGRETWLTGCLVPLQRDGRFAGMICVIHDATDRLVADRGLRNQAEMYRAVIETSLDGFLTLDSHGHLLEANDAYARMSGYRREELLQLNIADLEASMTPMQIGDVIARISRDGGSLFQTLHRAKNGRVRQVEINVSFWPIENGRLFVFVRDINQRERSEALLKARLQLSEIASQGNLDAIMQTALDLAEQFTGSSIGFFHFVEPDQETITLKAWSTRTLAAMCATDAKNQRCAASEAGAWAACVRERQPVIHNDYANLPERHPLPDEHVPLIRELTAPVMRDNRVVALIGVGNKPEDYVEEDLEAVRELASMVMDMVERKRVEERIEHLAYHDPLTQLPNRTLLTDRLRQAMAESKRGQRMLAVCFLDLDGFKPVNDTYGHANGDRVLVEVAHRLGGCVRAGDTVARLGGDEFAILFGNLNDVEECEHALERIMDALRVPFVVSGHPAHLSASVGVSLYPDDHADPDTLLRHADQAMYAAKQGGRNRYHLFDPEHDRRARVRRETLKRVKQGLAAGEFRLYFQPRVNMRDGGVAGAEALIRWQHPEEGLLPPIHYMPLVDNSELSVEVGQWVMREAMRQMSIWLRQGLRLPVSVNISGRHLQQPDFIDALAKLLAEFPEIPPHWLELEILETAALEDMAAVSNLVSGCRELGVRFALDDFGTGYSSLTYLRHLPVHRLKIDRSFVRDMLVDSEDLAIVEGVIGLSMAFRREVIAEGVETAAHGTLLMRLGCDLAQGFGIAHPLPAADMPAWLANWRPPPEWADLADYSWSRDDVPLLTVEIDHRRWIAQLTDYLERLAADPHNAAAQLPPGDNHDCRFGQWLNGPGRQRYGQRKGFRNIVELHDRVHAIAKALLAPPARIDPDALRGGLSKLHAARDKLIAALHGLQNQVARKRQDLPAE